MSPIVNRRDVEFLLFEVLQADRLFASEAFGHCDRSTIEALLDLAQRVAEDHFLPLAKELDEAEPHFADGRVFLGDQALAAVRAQAEIGLFAAGFPISEGGHQLPYSVCGAMNAMFTAANVGLSNYAFLSIASANLLRSFGSDELKARYLPHMLEGRWLGTMCLSEPQAGSSLGDITTMARRADDGSHFISGSKCWISGGDHDLGENIIHFVLAKTPGAPPGVRGISLFLVPKLLLNDQGEPTTVNNVSLIGLNHKMGQRASTNCNLAFGDEGPTRGFLVGELHQGLSQMFQMMNEARIGVGHSAASLGYAGYAASHSYALSRNQGRPTGNKDPLEPQVAIIHHADVRRMLLDQKARVEGALALATFCECLVDFGHASTDRNEENDLSALLDLLVPIVKSWPSEHGLRANELAIQIFGGAGYTRDFPVERIYRDNRLNHIHEGTYGIQAIDLLGRKVAARGGRGLEILGSRIAETTAKAGEVNGLAEECDRLTAAWHLALQAIVPIKAEPDRDTALANATPFLDAFGTVVVAWLWLKQAEVAYTKQACAVGNDSQFYAGKIASCRYYFRYILPHALLTFELAESLDKTALSVTASELLIGEPVAA